MTYRNIPLIHPGRIYGQRTNLISLYTGGLIFRMLIVLHIYIFGGLIYGGPAFHAHYIFFFILQIHLV